MKKVLTAVLTVVLSLSGIMAERSTTPLEKEFWNQKSATTRKFPEAAFPPGFCRYDTFIPKEDFPSGFCGYNTFVPPLTNINQEESIDIQRKEQIQIDQQKNKTGKENNI